MISLKYRSTKPELMDDLESSGVVIDQTLKELEVINKWLGGNQVTINGLRNLIRGKSHHAPLKVVDMGCGGGDMLKLIVSWADEAGITIELLGIDANPNIVEYARKNCSDPRITVAGGNVLDLEATPECDIIIATLFLHHFTDEELSVILQSWVQKATTGIIVNDIHRHWVAYQSISLLTRAFSRSEMVRNDAPLSVQRAFKRADLVDILKAANIEYYRLRWAWAFRWSLIIYPNDRNRDPS